MFRAHVLIIRRSKLHYIASGIITRIGGRLVHGQQNLEKEKGMTVFFLRSVFIGSRYQNFRYCINWLCATHESFFYSFCWVFEFHLSHIIFFYVITHR